MTEINADTREHISRSVKKMEQALGTKTETHVETYDDFEKRVDALTEAIITEIEKLKKLQGETPAEKRLIGAAEQDVRAAMEYMSQRFAEMEKKIDSILEIEMLVRELRDHALSVRDFAQQVRKEIAVIKAREETLASQVQEARDVVEKAKSVIENAKSALPEEQKEEDKNATAEEIEHAAVEMEKRVFPLLEKAEDRTKALEKQLAAERKNAGELNQKIKEMDLKNANKKITFRLINSLRKRVRDLEKTRASRKATSGRLKSLREAIDNVESERAPRASVAQRLKSVRSKVEAVESERAPKESTGQRIKSVRDKVEGNGSKARKAKAKKAAPKPKKKA